MKNKNEKTRITLEQARTLKSRTNLAKVLLDLKIEQEKEKDNDAGPKT